MLQLIKLSSGSSQTVQLDGILKQPIDYRDASYQLKAPNGLLKLPSIVDNRNICSPIEDQGKLGSCTAQVVIGLLEANQNRNLIGLQEESSNYSVTTKTNNFTSLSDGSVSFTTTITPSWKGARIQNVSLNNISVSGSEINFQNKIQLFPSIKVSQGSVKFIHGSRLFQYYATRRMMNTVRVDSGATMRGAIKAAAAYGTVDEDLWPYVISKFAVNPSSNIWSLAATKKISSYHAIADGDLSSMKLALSSGYLVAFGFMVYPHLLSREIASTGLLKNPSSNEKALGGHAVCLVGYDDSKVMPDGSIGAFLVRNSWGSNWAINGYFYMPYSYVGNPRLCWDFWIIKSSTLS